MSRRQPPLRPWSSRRPGVLLLVGFAAAVLAGCSSEGSGAPLPPPPPTVEVELADDDLVHDSPVPAGRVVFRVRNTGKAVHRVTLIPLPEDVPPLEEMLADDTARQIDLAARVSNLEPGETGMFAVDLAEGQRYALMDFSEADDGTTHGRLGVADEFRAGERAGPSSRESPDPQTPPAPEAGS